MGVAKRAYEYVKATFVVENGNGTMACNGAVECVLCSRTRRRSYVPEELCRLIARLTVSTVLCYSADCVQQCSGFYGILLPSLEHERLNLVRA